MSATQLTFAIGETTLIKPWAGRRFCKDFEGLEPAQFADMLALMGDASDNVPGVKGIGPRTALPLLVEHGSIEALLDNADKERAATYTLMPCTP